MPRQSREPVVPAPASLGEWLAQNGRTWLSRPVRPLVPVHVQPVAPVHVKPPREHRERRRTGEPRQCECGNVSIEQADERRSRACQRCRDIEQSHGNVHGTAGKRPVQGHTAANPQAANPPVWPALELSDLPDAESRAYIRHLAHWHKATAI
jgi:hypothetical protein